MNLIATQDNCITKEDQQAATAYYFGLPLNAAVAT